MNINFSPEEALGNDIEKMHKIIIISKNKGIITLFINSIPLFTPLNIKNITIKRKRVVSMHGRTGEETKFSK